MTKNILQKEQESFTDQYFMSTRGRNDKRREAIKESNKRVREHTIQEAVEIVNRLDEMTDYRTGESEGLIKVSKLKSNLQELL